MPGDDDAAIELKRLTVTRLYNAGPQWLLAAQGVSMPPLQSHTVGTPTSPTTRRCGGFSRSSRHAAADHPSPAPGAEPSAAERQNSTKNRTLANGSTSCSTYGSITPGLSSPSVSSPGAAGRFGRGVDLLKSTTAPDAGRCPVRLPEPVRDGLVGEIRCPSIRLDGPHTKTPPAQVARDHTPPVARPVSRATDRPRLAPQEAQRGCRRRREWRPAYGTWVLKAWFG